MGIQDFTTKEKKNDVKENSDLWLLINKVVSVSSELKTATQDINNFKVDLDKTNNNIKEDLEKLNITLQNFKKNATASKEFYKYIINICFFIVLISILWLFYNVLGVKALDYIYIFIMGFLGAGAGIMLSLYSIKKL
jgi:ATP-dependent Zn protease